MVFLILNDQGKNLVMEGKWSRQRMGENEVTSTNLIKDRFTRLILIGKHNVQISMTEELFKIIQVGQIVEIS